MIKHSKEQISKMGKAIMNEIDAQFPYATARNNQKFVIYQIVKSYLEGKKYFVLEASTGFGKSAAAVTAMRVIASLFPKESEDDGKLPLTSLICTKTKSLQTQYNKDYTEIASLWSAPGYECNKEPFNPEVYFKAPNCDRAACSFFKKCNYRVAKNAFISAPMGVLNYAYFMHFQKHEVNLVTFDEAHNLEKILVDHLHVKFNPAHTKTVLDRLCSIGFIRDSAITSIIENLVQITEVSDTDTNWFETIVDKSAHILYYLDSVIDKIEIEKRLLDEVNSNLSDEDRKIFTYNSKIVETLVSKLGRLINSKVEWVISERDGETSIDLKPISLTEEAGSLFSRADFFILMSATICGIPLFCKTLGIGEDEYSSLSLDSEVPVENRRIVPVNLKGMSMATRESLLPVYTGVLDTLIEKYGKESRQLVHSVTYENAEYILANSKFKKRMIIPETEDLMEIKKILDQNSNSILVTPAMTEGSDLSGDYCRAIYWFKIPFPYLGDKWVARKKDIDNDWYLRETINQVVQGCGRGVRSTDDYAITFVLDGNFNKIRYKQDLMPRWFSNAIVET